MSRHTWRIQEPPAAHLRCVAHVKRTTAATQSYFRGSGACGSPHGPGIVLVPLSYFSEAPCPE
eukprot:4445113-Alexandrium_andersonii.AAC.1